MQKRAKDENWLSVPPAKRAHAADTARKLRQSATAGEVLLWQALRNRQLDGLKFRRQQAIGTFIVDFYCAEASLAVEIDGSIHEGREGHDAERQRLIEATGVGFLRFTEEHVRSDLPGVLATLRHRLEHQSPPESPLSARRRGAGGEVPRSRSSRKPEL